MKSYLVIVPLLVCGLAGRAQLKNIAVAWKLCRVTQQAGKYELQIDLRKQLLDYSHIRLVVSYRRAENLPYQLDTLTVTNATLKAGSSYVVALNNLPPGMNNYSAVSLLYTAVIGSFDQSIYKLPGH
jgi:hypothetical protein